MVTKTFVIDDVTHNKGKNKLTVTFKQEPQVIGTVTIPSPHQISFDIPAPTDADLAAFVEGATLTATFSAAPPQKT